MNESYGLLMVVALAFFGPDENTMCLFELWLRRVEGLDTEPT